MNKNTDVRNAKRIAVIGCPGAGKTTFSVKLNKLLNNNLYHLDLLYWDANWGRTENDVWIAKVKEVAGLSTWIIDGNYIDTLDIRIEQADLVIYLDVSASRCIWNSIKRIIMWDSATEKSYAKKIPLSKPTLSQQIKLLRLIFAFNQKQRHRIYTMISLFKKPALILKNKNDINNLLLDLSSTMPAVQIKLSELV